MTRPPPRCSLIWGSSRAWPASRSGQQFWCLPPCPSGVSCPSGTDLAMATDQEPSCASRHSDQDVRVLDRGRVPLRTPQKPPVIANRRHRSSSSRRGRSPDRRRGRRGSKESESGPAPSDAGLGLFEDPRRLPRGPGVGQRDPASRSVMMGAAIRRRSRRGDVPNPVEP